MAELDEVFDEYLSKRKSLKNKSSISNNQLLSNGSINNNKGNNNNGKQQTTVSSSSSSTATTRKRVRAIAKSTLVSKPKIMSGSECFRQRIIYATLTGQPIHINNIRSKDDNPGIRDYEASFLRLIDKMCNGTAIKINETGTSLWYRPGVIQGGAHLSHDCATSRGITYYIEGLICLAPFAKNHTQFILTGVTNHHLDLSTDTIRGVTIPIVKQFAVESIDVKVKKRGFAPNGGGEVEFTCDIVKELKPIDWIQTGKVKRIRGVAVTSKVSPQFSNRLVEKARGVLNNFIPDVYIYSDHYKGRDSGESAGYSVSLVASSTNNTLISAEITAKTGDLPEDVGQQVAQELIAQIAQGGCVDTNHQSLVLLFMVLCPEDLSRVRFGPLSQQTISTLRLLKEYFGVTFKIKASTEDKMQKQRFHEKKEKEAKEEQIKKERKEQQLANHKWRKKRRRLLQEDKSKDEKENNDKNKTNNNKKDDSDDDDDDGGDDDDDHEEQNNETNTKNNDNDNDDENESPTVMLSCLGIGFKNFARPSI